jgi:hypothetical protein
VIEVCRVEFMNSKYYRDLIDKEVLSDISKKAAIG